MHVCCGVLATRLESSEGADGSVAAEAVELMAHRGRNTKYMVTARREIVLYCGALRTTQLLLLRFVLAV